MPPVPTLPRRPVQLRTSFKKLASHRIPTLWSLYRPLLRKAPRSVIKKWIRQRFRLERHLTSQVLIKDSLVFFHKALREFEQWHANQERRILHRYLSHASAFAKAQLRKAPKPKLPERKPIIKPGIIKASLDRKPMLRLHPQPAWISAMIRRRIKRYNQRDRGQKELNTFLQDSKWDTLERDLGVKEEQQFWTTEYKNKARDAFGFRAYQRAALARAKTPIRAWMKRAVKEARQRKAKSLRSRRAREDR
ncbi:hypothetical protein BT69DRAFT_1282791 [Atractiella rhizophila]|nr:hypothetical protein BT69DRAFT_1282791 [Atractiella rhizophila]